jgi:tRNA-Thr(GGU) m(6)t(6)A37 methyltransferase TsaA
MKDINVDKIEIIPLGVIQSPYKKRGDAPRQGRNSDIVSKITVYDEYAEALDGIDKYTHLIILYWLDRSDGPLLKVIPPGQTQERGVFSTRAPSRPNQIAFCVVDLVDRKNNVLTVRGLDAFDRSLIVDIKPYLFGLDNICD